MTMESRTRPGGRISFARVTVTNSSDITVTVPAGKMWDVYLVIYQINTTATVGNRFIGVMLGDGTNPAWTSIVSGNIAASQYGGIYCQQNINSAVTNVRRRLDSTANGLTVCQTDVLPMPCLLTPGQTIRMMDFGVIDAAADDGFYVIGYIEYDV